MSLLGKMRSKAAVPALIDLMRSYRQDSPIESEAWDALFEIAMAGDLDLLQTWIGLLENGNAREKSLAAIGISYIGKHAQIAAPALVRSLSEFKIDSVNLLNREPPEYLMLRAAASALMTLDRKDECCEALEAGLLINPQHGLAIREVIQQSGCNP